MKNYATFNGRARRKEYWMYMLFVGLFALLFGSLMSLLVFILGPFEIFLLVPFFLVFLVPSIAVTVRRLHDTNKSGWWLLIPIIPIIPIIGAIWLFVLMVTEGDRQENQYGPDPKAIEAEIENA
ncbi:MAG: DUF805 domain-containing protein [Paludibacteraceae bacterium]